MSDKVVRSWRWIFPSFIIFTTIAAVLIGTVGFGGQKNNEDLVPDKKSYYAIFPAEVPDTVDFAGESVPLEQFDVYEALDRELLSNVFFHSQTIRLIKLSNRYFPVIEPILAAQGIPDDFKYLAVAESGLANVVSSAQAVGFWQIRKGTAIDYGLEVNNEIDERYHLERSTEAACKYLMESYEKYDNWTTTAASYNVGRKGIDREMTRQKKQNYYDLLLNEETARYLFRIIALKLIIQDPAAYGFQLSKKDLYEPIPYTTIDVDHAVADFADFAFEHETNYKMLKYLNPWLRDNTLTNKSGKTYNIKIPEKEFRPADSQAVFVQ
ncbi:lytic transglycosylase domain-containing protein [Bacteroidota bacterium]